MASVMSGNANPAQADSFISRSMLIALSSPSVAPRSLAPCLPADGGPHPTPAAPPGGHPALRPTAPSAAGRHAPSPDGGERVRLTAAPSPFHGQLLEPAMGVHTHFGGDLHP